MNDKVVAIVQARCDSTRLPNKVLLEVGDFPIIKFLVLRLQKCLDINEVILATTNSLKDNPLALIANQLGIKCIRGSEQDVLSRYVKAAKYSECDNIIRITGDCPLIDPDLISETIKTFS